MRRLANRLNQSNADSVKTVFFSHQDLQFVITLSFRDLWYLRSRKSTSHLMSLVEVMEYYHPECRDMKYLDEDDCRLLVVMDSFDFYQAALDWEVPACERLHTDASQWSSWS